MLTPVVIETRRHGHPVGECLSDPYGSGVAPAAPIGPRDAAPSARRFGDPRPIAAVDRTNERY
jgi:hypothetical protein